MTRPRLARDVVRKAVEDGDLDLSPAYQRGSVWTVEQRLGLIRSWLTGVPIPAVVISDRTAGGWPVDAGGLPVGGHGYAVIDGKQRIETAIAWFTGALAVPASWFAPEWVDATTPTDDGEYVRFYNLSPAGQRRVSNRALLPVIETPAGSEAEEAQLYLLLNGAGTPQTDADLANAAQLADPKVLEGLQAHPRNERVGSVTLRIPLEAVTECESWEMPEKYTYLVSGEASIVGLDLRERYRALLDFFFTEESIHLDPQSSAEVEGYLRQAEMEAAPINIDLLGGQRDGAR